MDPLLWPQITWQQLILAIVVGLPATLAAIATFIRTVQNGWKTNDLIAENTELTKRAGNTASDSAKLAAQNAIEAKRASDNLALQFNGALDGRMARVVKEHFEPLQKVLEGHAEVVAAHIKQDEQNLTEIKSSLEKLTATGATSAKERTDNRQRIADVEKSVDDLKNKVG